MRYITFTYDKKTKKLVVIETHVEQLTDDTNHKFLQTLSVNQS